MLHFTTNWCTWCKNVMILFWRRPDMRACIGCSYLCVHVNVKETRRKMNDWNLKKFRMPCIDHVVFIFAIYWYSYSYFTIYIVRLHFLLRVFFCCFFFSPFFSNSISSLARFIHSFQNQSCVLVLLLFVVVVVVLNEHNAAVPYSSVHISDLFG